MKAIYALTDTFTPLNLIPKFKCSRNISIHEHTRLEHRIQYLYL